MTIELIYATWPNRPNGVGWADMAAALRKDGLTAKLRKAGFEVGEDVLTASGEGAGELKAGFELAAQIGALVDATHKVGSLAVIVCGSCSVAALGAVSGLGGENTGILWMDAHPDLNTPATTMSGLLEGMACAIVLGDAWQMLAIDVAHLRAASRRNLCFYGARDIDPAERSVIEDDAIAIAEDAEGVIDALDGCERAYIHLDMDVHNAALMRVNRFSGEGGPSPEDVRQTLETVTAALPVAAIALTALDPEIGAEHDAVQCAIGHISATYDAWRAAQSGS